VSSSSLSLSSNSCVFGHQRGRLARQHATSFFRYVHINSKKCLFVSTYLSVCLSVCMHRCGSHWTNFRSISYCGLLRKSVKILNIWWRLDNYIWHSIWRHTCKDVSTVDSSLKYSVARQGKIFCLFHGNTERFYLLTIICMSAIQVGKTVLCPWQKDLREGATLLH